MRKLAGFIDSISGAFQLSLPIPRFLVSAIARSFAAAAVSRVLSSPPSLALASSGGFWKRREEEIGVDNKDRDNVQLVAVFLLPSQVCTCLATFLSSFF
jgi:hypothetical protein